MKALLLFTLLIISASTFFKNADEIIENDTQPSNGSSREVSQMDAVVGANASRKNDLDVVALPTANFVSTNNLQRGLGIFALISALFGLAGLVFRVPCLLRVTAGLYVAYLVILTVPVIYFAQTAIQGFLSETRSEWAWFYLLGFLFAMIFLVHGCMVILKARRETMNPKEKYEHMTREEQWW